jgi:glycosyltransferase involved in cell wall biosynthesis
VALITNHGYAGAEIPVGGAPDTGGQNFYVNQLAATLERLGYAVTIFTRGGFAFFGSDRLREGTELLSTHVRYVYVPGGGDGFIRKEDIALALDEQVGWLADFVALEAREAGCEPWDFYEFVNTHYWDAAVLGVLLVERFRDDVAAKWLADLLRGAVDDSRLATLGEKRRWLSVGSDPAYRAGALLAAGRPAAQTPETWAVTALKRWASGRDVGDLGAEAATLAERIREASQTMSPVVLTEAATSWLGESVLAAADPDGVMTARLRDLDRHVWTPHSIGELKDLNCRNKPVEERRALKFCERRNHERMVADRTRAFASTSGEITEHLLTRFGVPVESVFYFPPCVDRTLFRPYEGEALERTYLYLASCSGIDVERLKAGTIVFETSRQDLTKRKDVLLEAFSIAAADRPETFLFIGGGPENEVFEANLALRDSDPVLARQAFLLGFVPDDELYPMFGLADIFVTPSEMEGFGMSVSQAAAAGTAIVSSDLVPFCTLFVPDDALIVAAGDVQGFARAIVRLLDDPADRLRRAGNLAQATLALDWEAQTRAFIDHIRRRGIGVAAPV